MYSKEDFRREFVVNILIGFVVAETTLLYLFAEIDEAIYALTSIPFLILYFVSKLGFYKIAFFFGTLFIFILSYIPLYVFGTDMFPSFIALSLLLVMVYAIADIWNAVLFIIIVVAAFFMPKSILTHNIDEINSVLKYLFFPLAAGVTLCVGWLPNQRARESLRKIRRTQSLLKTEKNMLDIRLKQRTASLMRLAELGVATKRMVHDISTPLNVILLNIHQINIHDLKKTRSAVIRAQYCAESMTKFVGSVKEKMENQENRTWFPLGETLETVKKICETNRIHIRIVVNENSVLYGNESKLLQAVVNIVQNSVDSYEERKGRIQIKAVLQNNVLELAVSDRGKGMDGEMVENLGTFTTKTDTLLNGVGYEAAREITQRDFNGDIRTKSTKGRGTKTTMQIKVPIRLDSDLPRQPQRLP